MDEYGQYDASGQSLWQTMTLCSFSDWTKIAIMARRIASGHSKDSIAITFNIRSARAARLLTKQSKYWLLWICLYTSTCHGLFCEDAFSPHVTLILVLFGFSTAKIISWRFLFVMALFTPSRQVWFGCGDWEEGEWGKIRWWWALVKEGCNLGK